MCWLLQDDVDAADVLDRDELDDLDFDDVKQVLMRCTLTAGRLTGMCAVFGDQH